MTLFWLVYCWAFYAAFLVYCTVRRAKKSGKIAAAPWIVQAVLYSYLFLGVVMDFIFNITLGAVLFLELPWGHGWLFTARCKEHRQESGTWRKELADWFCEGWLNPFDDSHC